MNKRRRYRAKRRRATERLKQLWLSGGLSAVDLLMRLHTRRGQLTVSLQRNGRVVIPRSVPPPEFQNLRPRDLHQERADREGIPRSLAKMFNYAELYK